MGCRDGLRGEGIGILDGDAIVGIFRVEDDLRDASAGFWVDLDTRRAGRGILLGPAALVVDPYERLLGAGTDGALTFVGLVRSTGGGVARGVLLPDPLASATGILDGDPTPTADTLGAIFVGVFPSLALLPTIDPFTGVGDPSPFSPSCNSSTPSLNRRTAPFRGEDLGEASRDRLSK
jgi:hypothetical protein